MSLRESVFQKVKERPEPDGIDMEEFYDITIQEIEKRIDSFIDESKKRQEQRRKDKDTDKFYEGWFAAIEYFKERELLR